MLVSVISRKFKQALVGRIQNLVKLLEGEKLGFLDLSVSKLAVDGILNNLLECIIGPGEVRIAERVQIDETALVDLAASPVRASLFSNRRQ